MRKRRLSWKGPLLLLVALAVSLGWLTYAQIRHERLNRTLMAAIQQSDTNKALAMLSEGADPDTRDYPRDKLALWQQFLNMLHGKWPGSADAPTALLRACFQGGLRVRPPDNAPMVKALLDRGANVDVTNIRGETPLILAVWCGKRQVSQLLIQQAGAKE